MRVLRLSAELSARHRGEAHGRDYRHEIRSLAELRTHLACRISGHSRGELLDLAEDHVPVLRSADRDLYEEFCGIASAAGVSLAELVVLNHYTDIRDIKAAGRGHELDVDGGCTMVWARTASGPVFAQTWDMHASAAAYTMMMQVPDAAGGKAWLLTLTGCLGMAGVNADRLVVGINNLPSTDAQVGLLWPAVVRMALRRNSAGSARDLILGAPLGSGHHYLVAAGDDVFGIETSGRERVVCFSGEKDSYVHANHCLDLSVAGHTAVPATSTSGARYASLVASVAAEPVRDVDDAWRRIGSVEGFPASVCTNTATAENPHAPATCAGFAVDPARGDVLAVSGFTHNVEPERFSLVEDGS